MTTSRQGPQRHDDISGTRAGPTGQDAILLGQRTAGNQAVLRALTGASADSAEREADRIGDSVADAAARTIGSAARGNTVAGGELEIEDQLVALRSDLEVLLEGSPEFAGLRIDENEEILTKTFDASAGDFGTANLLNRAAFVAAGTRGGIPASAFHVHMSIAVFRTEPSWNTAPVDYIDPTDFFGMVPRTPSKTAP